jgi:hypothetical protein
MIDPSPLVADLVARLSPDVREDFEERAAIIEFDSLQPREDAECFALIDVLRRHPGALLSGVIFRGRCGNTHRYVISTSEQRAQVALTQLGAVAIERVEFEYAIDDVLGGLAELVPVPRG